jgi:hypothetical protein
MNKSVFLLFNVVLVALVACKNDPKLTNTDPNRPENFQAGEIASPKVLAGHWIDLDFCARAGQYGSVLQTMNNSHVPYAYAVTFYASQPDSVICYNAFETWMVPVKYRQDTMELVGAVQGKPVFLNYHSQGDKDMTMYDNSSGRTKMDNFIKSRATTATGYEAFTTALNHHLFNGTFTPVGKGGGNKVAFNPTGLLQGLKEYDHYEVCTGGDCFVAGQEIDIVTFYNAKQGKEQSSKMYGYRYNGGNDTLSIYNMVNAKPEEKGGYKVGTLAYKFARQISVPVIAKPLEPKKN